MIHISKCHIVFVSIRHTNTLTLGYSRLDVLKFLWSICLSASASLLGTKAFSCLDASTNTIKKHSHANGASLTTLIVSNCS